MRFGRRAHAAMFMLCVRVGTRGLDGPPRLGGTGGLPPVEGVAEDPPAGLERGGDFPLLIKVKLSVRIQRLLTKNI